MEKEEKEEEINQEEEQIKRRIEIIVTEEEKRKLEKAKGDRTWREFLLTLSEDISAKDKEILNELKTLCQKLNYY